MVKDSELIKCVFVKVFCEYTQIFKFDDTFSFLVIVVLISIAILQIRESLSPSCLKKQIEKLSKDKTVQNQSKTCMVEIKMTNEMYATPKQGLQCQVPVLVYKARFI